MENVQNKENRIINGVIWKQLLIFFFPIVLGTFFQQIYNTADAVVVGRFVGTEALAAVGGSTSQIINLIVGFFVGLSSGATVVISQYYGAREKQGLQNALHTAFAFSVVGSVVISVIGIWLSPMMLRWMNTTEEVIAPSTTYLRIYFAGIIFVFIYNVGSSILRAVGDSRRPLYYLIVCCLINILLDVVLVVFFHMGVAGAAIATVFAQGVSAVLVVLALCRSKDIFRLELKQVRFHRDALELLLKIGLPAGLQSVMYSASNIIIQTSLNSFGTNTMAAWTAYGKIDSFFWMVISAFGISITTFVGQNYGARKFGRMRKSVRICIGMAMGASVVISAVFLIFGKYVYQMFTTDATVIEIGMHMMTLMGTGVCGVCLYRSLLGCAARYRRRAGADADDLRRCVRTQSAVGLVHRSAQAGHRHHPLQLSNLMDADSAAVHLLLSKKMPAVPGQRRITQKRTGGSVSSSQSLLLI